MNAKINESFLKTIPNGKAPSKRRLRCLLLLDTSSSNPADWVQFDVGFPFQEFNIAREATVNFDGNKLVVGKQWQNLMPPLDTVIPSQRWADGTGQWYLVAQTGL